MIEAEFLAALRRKYRAELVLVLVQLEQLCPGYWSDLTELAEQLGTDRATLNRSIRKLEDLNLLRRASISNGGGTWVWWIARHQADKPDETAEPVWVIRDLHRRKLHRVKLTERWVWGARYGLPRGTLRSFLMGGQMTMRERWQLVSTPFDYADALDTAEGV